MASLTDELLSQLSGPATQQIAGQLGLDPQQASGAIGAALPLLLGKLGSNAAQPQGAQALLGALQNNHSGLDIGSVLGAVLGGSGGAEADGAGILGHIFGGQQATQRAPTRGRRFQQEYPVHPPPLCVNAGAGRVVGAARACKSRGAEANAMVRAPTLPHPHR